MDKYKIMMNKIIDMTKNHRLSWMFLTPDYYPKVIISPEKIARSFMAKLELHGTIYFLLIVEKFSDRDDYDFSFGLPAGWSYTGNVEMYILDDQKNLIQHVVEGLVDGQDLIDLMDYASDESNVIKKFYDSITSS